MKLRLAILGVLLLCCSCAETEHNATQYKIGRFTKQDIRELCPSLSISSIEGSLRKLVDNGEIKREGKGKSTFYYRTY